MSECHFCGLDASTVAELRMAKGPHEGATQVPTRLNYHENALMIRERRDTRRHPGLIRRILGMIGISCCVLVTTHMSMDLGARVAADVHRAQIEHCGRC